MRSRAQCTLRTRYGATVRSDNAVVLCGFACVAFQCTAKMSHFQFVAQSVCAVCIRESFLESSRISVICNAAGTVNLVLYTSIFCTVSAAVRELLPLLPFIIYRLDDGD